MIIDEGTSDSTNVTSAEHRLLQQFDEDVVLLRLTGPLSYAVSRRLAQRLNAMKPPRFLLIDLASASIIGVSTTLAIEKLISAMKASGTVVKLIEEYRDIRPEFRQLGMIDLVGEHNCATDFEEAINAAIQTP